MGWDLIGLRGLNCFARLVMLLIWMSNDYSVKSVEMIHYVRFRYILILMGNWHILLIQRGRSTSAAPSTPFPKHKVVGAWKTWYCVRMICIRANISRWYIALIDKRNRISKSLMIHWMVITGKEVKDGASKAAPSAICSTRTAQRVVKLILRGLQKK